MSFKITPIALTVRGYSEDIDTSQSLYDLRNTPHEYMCTVQIVENSAFVSAFMGEINLKDRRNIAKTLKEEYGITEFIFRRGDNLIAKAH